MEALLGSHAKFLGSHARMHNFWAVMRFLDRFEKPCRVKAALGSHFRPFAEIGLEPSCFIDSGPPAGQPWAVREMQTDDYGAGRKAHTGGDARGSISLCYFRSGCGTYGMPDGRTQGVVACYAAPYASSAK